jgi:hypothetical protein
MRAMRFADNYNDVQDCSKENVGLGVLNLTVYRNLIIHRLPVQEPDNEKITCAES